MDGKCTEDRMDKLVRTGSATDYYTSQDLCQCWLGTGAWDNVVNGLDFDNVANAFGTLYEISTTEGWVDVLYAGIDGTDAFMQPIRGHNKAAIIYFILFMLFGAFFVMQLFVGVIMSASTPFGKKRSGGQRSDGLRNRRTEVDGQAG